MWLIFIWHVFLTADFTHWWISPGLSSIIQWNHRGRMMASTASAKMEGRFLPPPASSPRPSFKWAPRDSSWAIWAKLPSQTRVARVRVSSPSSSLRGWFQACACKERDNSTPLSDNLSTDHPKSSGEVSVPPRNCCLLWTPFKLNTAPLWANVVLASPWQTCHPDWGASRLWWGGLNWGDVSGASAAFTSPGKNVSQDSTVKSSNPWMFMCLNSSKHAVIQIFHTFACCAWSKAFF